MNKIKNFPYLLFRQKIITLEELRRIRKYKYKEGPEGIDGRFSNLVVTNGCFDILHRGHLEFLRFSKTKGDFLIVGVNDDKSVAELKPGRPINPIEDRLIQLAALEFVSAVVPFSGLNCSEFLYAAIPRVFTKASKMTLPEPEALILKEFNTRIEYFECNPKYSTTNLIKKIKNLPI